MGRSHTNTRKERRCLGQQPLPSDPLFSPSSTKLSSPRQSPDVNSSLTRALGVVFHTGGFVVTVTIMGRKAAQALFRVHSSVWVTFGCWLISARPVCRGGF